MLVDWESGFCHMPHQTDGAETQQGAWGGGVCAQEVVTVLKAERWAVWVGSAVVEGTVGSL